MGARKELEAERALHAETLRLHDVSCASLKLARSEIASLNGRLRTCTRIMEEKAAQVHELAKEIENLKLNLEAQQSNWDDVRERVVELGAYFEVTAQ